MDESTARTSVAEHRSILKAALLLQRLGSHDRAIDSLQKILTHDPYNVQALRSIARSWQAVGAFDQARQALERARETTPDDMQICMEIAEIFVKTSDYEGAYRSLSRALEIDPNSTAANRAMVETLDRLGRPEDALKHRQRRTPIMPSVISAAALEPLDAPIRVLVIAAGDSSHPTIKRALRRHDFAMQILHIESLSSNVLLPSYDVLFTTLRFAPNYRSTLLHLEGLLVHKAQPVVNRPAAVLATDPSILAWRLAPVEGLRVAPRIRLERKRLLSLSPDGLARELGFGFPLIVRAEHRELRRRESVASFDDLQTFVQSDGAGHFECSPLLDLRSADGRIRCYRVAVIGDEIFPIAFASGYHWRVDFAVNDAAPASMQAEEATFFDTVQTMLGERHMERIRAISHCLEIDMCVMDVGLDDSSELTVLRVDASSDWAEPPDEESFASRRRASDRARQAIFRLILDRVDSLPLDGGQSVSL